MKSQGSCLLIGNSRWHWAIEENNKWHFIHEEPGADQFLTRSIPILAWAAVGIIPENISLDADNHLHLTDIPKLIFPSWVGIDRALGSFGALKKARELNSTKSKLVIIDAGTILSITKINSNGEFIGGQLIPGIKLQLSAMTEGAKNLSNPGRPKDCSLPYYPKSTGEAMQRGAIQSLLGAIIESSKKEDEMICLCGGDSDLLHQELKKNALQVFHYPHLVLEGMVEVIKSFK